MFTEKNRFLLLGLGFFLYSSTLQNARFDRSPPTDELGKFIYGRFLQLKLKATADILLACAICSLQTDLMNAK